MNGNPVRVLLADDTLIAREGWKKILETADDIVVVGEAENAQETPRKVHETMPDVILMDLKWYGDPTIAPAVIREIKKAASHVKIIAITAYEELVRGARHAGADGVLLKDFTRQELLGLIRELHGGVLDFQPRDDFAVDLPDSPSKRELEVLALVDQGYSDKEIADVLTISEYTAKNHVRSILSKLGAKNRTHAVKIARERGLLT